MDVATLVRQAQSGDRDAAGELIDQFYPTVRAICRRRCKANSRADDTTQTVFLQMLRRLGQVHEPERFAGWLQQIAFRETARPPKHVDQLDGDTLTTADCDPQDAAARREEARMVHAALARLKPMHREVLAAFYLRGETMNEISAALRVPLGTVKQRLHTAKRWLKEELTKAG